MGTSIKLSSPSWLDKIFHDILPFTKQCLVLMTQKRKPLENIVRKGQDAGNQHLLLFPPCFYSIKDK